MTNLLVVGGTFRGPEYFVAKEFAEYLPVVDEVTEKEYLKKIQEIKTHSDFCNLLVWLDELGLSIVGSPHLTGYKADATPQMNSYVYSPLMMKNLFFDKENRPYQSAFVYSTNFVTKNGGLREKVRTLKI